MMRPQPPSLLAKSSHTRSRLILVVTDTDVQPAPTIALVDIQVNQHY